MNGSLAVSPFARGRAPAWATDWGQDRYGLYADFELSGVSQRMRWIAPGAFKMGSPPNEPERSDREAPHDVRLTEGFWLAETACTQQLWQAVTGSNPSRFSKGDEAPHRPVERVSWEECQGFLHRANQLAPGLELRLPTEAQWEYACRAGTTTPFAFGNTITPDQVNYNGNFPYPGGREGLFRQTTVPAKSFDPNARGLYQMHGNVWEWCADWYGLYETERGVNPTGPPEGASRVLRGGSWFGLAQFCRSASRNLDGPAARYGLFGFRFARGQDSG